jgi:hypothetical protein
MGEIGSKALAASDASAMVSLDIKPRAGRENTATKGRRGAAPALARPKIAELMNNI